MKKIINEKLELKVFHKDGELYFYSGEYMEPIAIYDKDNYIAFESQLFLQVEEVKEIIKYIDENKNSDIYKSKKWS